MTPRAPFAGALLALAAGLAPPALAQDPTEDQETPAVADAADATDDSAPISGAYDAVFKDDLYVGQPLMLNGILALREVPFALPPNWEVTGDLELHLLLDHSETLLPRRSSMTILVNNRAVDSFFLDETNAVQGEVIARVPRDVLDPEYNVITLTAVQHYTTDCEDPFDPNLWSRISNESFLRVPYRRKPIQPDLVQFPAPFYNPNGLGPVELSLVTSGTVPQPTIEALGILGLAFGRIADYRGVEVTETVGSVREATGHAVLVGLYDAHPDIRDLVGLQGADADDGVVALVPNPADPSLAVLVVTGKTEDALRDAAYAVAAQDSQEVLSGPQTIVREVAHAFPDSRRKPTPAPPASEFALSDMEFEDTSVRGFYSDPVVIPLMLEGDAQVKRPDGGKMRLHYAYSAQLDTRLSTVEVSLNGVVLASRPLDKPDGDQDAFLDVKLPPDLIEPKSTIKVQFHLFPKEFDACERVSDRIIWGTVFAKTRLSVPRDHYAAMPDIGRLAYDLWPFTMASDSSSVTVVAPDAPSRQDAAAVFTVASALGYKRTATRPRFRATTADAVGTEQHMILLHSGGRNTQVEALEQGAALRLAQNATGGQLLSDEDDVVLDADARTTFGWIEEIQRPEDPRRTVLLLRSTSPEHILPLSQVLHDDTRLGKLELRHNIAVIPEEVEGAEIAYLRRGETHEVGNRPISARVTLGLARFWPAFFFLLLGAALLFALAVSLWARRNGAHT